MRYSSSQFSSQFGIFVPIGAWDVAAPDAPATISAVGGNKQVTVTWASVTGATSYDLYWADHSGVPLLDSNKIAGVTSPYTHSGLANGTAYYYVVVALNANGAGPASSEANATTLAVPDAPTIGTATRGNAQASVTFTANSPGGSPITSFTATSDTGNHSATGAGSPLTVTGLTNGTSYAFTVVATNAEGDSLPSDRSNRVTPATVPDAPTIGTATAGDTTASVAFTPPANNGGSAITGYTATSTPSSITGTGPSSPIAVSGLSNGTAYTFTVHATNAVGNSAESAASNSVTPSLTPSTSRILLHFDGTNGATTTTDAYGNTVTFQSTANLTTSYAKFGPSCLNCYEASDVNINKGVRVGGVSLGASGGWTIECFVMWPTVPSNLLTNPVFTAGNDLFYGVNIALDTFTAWPTKYLMIRLSANGSGYDINNTEAAVAINDAAWNHLAVVRDESAGKYYVYWNGTSVFEKATASEICAINKMLVGTDNITGTGGRSVRGYIDEFRMRDSCIYPGGTSFTPPSSAFTS